MTIEDVIFSAKKNGKLIYKKNMEQTFTATCETVPVITTQEEKSIENPQF